MALVDVGMPCALCRSPINDPRCDTFATTYWGIDDDRFAVLDDAACHQACIDEWEHRDAFLDYYNRNCKNELHVDRHGHVNYKCDYRSSIGGAIIVSLAVLLCSPSLALLELGWRTRTAQITAFVAPYLMLVGFLLACTIEWSLGLALTFALIAWIIATLAALIVVVAVPALRQNLR